MQTPEQLNRWIEQDSDPKVLAHYIDTLIVGLIRRVGLKVKVKRTATTTTLTIHLRRTDAEQSG